MFEPDLGEDRHGLLDALDRDAFFERVFNNTVFLDPMHQIAFEVFEEPHVDELIRDDLFLVKVAHRCVFGPISPELLFLGLGFLAFAIFGGAVPGR